MLHWFLKFLIPKLKVKDPDQGKLNELLFNVEKWIEHLQGHNKGVSITYLDVVDIVLTQGARARVAIAGEKDVAAVFRESMPQGQQGRIESAKVRYPFSDGTNLVVELGCRASIKAPASFPAEEIQALRKAMLLSIKG